MNHLKRERQARAWCKKGGIITTPAATRTAARAGALRGEGKIC